MNWSHMPPLSTLRAFEAFATYGSLTEAGARLNVSHAAVSQHLKNLETHMGVTLLDRSGRTMILTPEGQRLAAALHDGFGRIWRCVEDLTEADAARPLNIDTTPSFASNWLMPRIAGFRAEHPGIEIMISVDANLNDPTPGAVDVAIRYGAGGWPDLDSEMLVPTSIAAVVAPDVVKGRDVSSPHDLLDFPWLQELGTSEASKWLALQGVTNARVASLLHVPGNLMLDGARSGQGIAVTARLWVEEDLRSGRLLCLFENSETQGYHLVTAPGVQRASVKAFLKWVRREARNR
ncbi:LysR family transcriptional regulator [Pseudoprimorskyibacter insulae]|uniref:Glycine cleavage system transcriptional activator n=1 Tax=Pseudoprimorskyibacter insulae TaxID=1695997 RepID=A0A2R8AV73_9RHOB|nr:LysR family transcriptional regulator [Pseudoprimorskyibacter insulae]SPF79935.1 Glycine cleavage system transcriptional activator [Pseudoprimorskyibacter insulae]